MQTFLGSTDGRVRFPKKDSWLCLEADYELLRLLPTKRSPTMPDATRIPPWLSQRRCGEAPPPRHFVSMGHNAQEGEPPTVGTWPAEDTVHLWDKLPNHRDSWPLILVFAGRVLTRFSYRMCQGGTLVSRDVP
eukprot:5650816-Pyramimonas_sp.AAC.1